MTDSKRSTRNQSPNKQKLGPYILIEKLGRGGFGVVWKAIEKGNVAARPVALKLAQDENEDLYEIIREARLWVKASGHPNVLPIIKAFLHNKRIVIVSEYAQDGPLDRWLKKHDGKAPSIHAAMKMVDGILSGLRYLHTATPDKPQIIHRDLKPSN